MLEVRLHMLAGNLMRALNHVERAVELARHPRQPLALAASLRCLGSINVRLGMHAAAASQFSEALSLADTCMAPYERALTLFARAELEVATGNVGPAGLLLDEIRATAVELQAVPLLYRAESLQHTLAEVQATPAVHWLSPRELEVVAHIIEGRSNQEIADSLLISPRTVANHVASIMNKLGVDSRTAAATWAIRQGIA